MMTRKLLAVAGAVAVMFLAAGCASKSDGGDKSGAAPKPGPTYPGQGNVPGGRPPIILENPNGNPIDSQNPGPGGTPTGGNEQCYKAVPMICDAEIALLRMVNELRAGRGPIQNHKQMSWVARVWSETQGRRGSIGHDGFPNQRMQVYRAEFNTNDVDMSAENVAMSGMGTSGAESLARELFDMWKNSPGHRSNMMGSYRYIGIGIFADGDSVYGTQIFGD